MAQNEWWKTGGTPVESSTDGEWWKSGGTPVDDEPPKRGLKGWAQDLGAGALDLAIGVPEAAVGLLDIPTGGAAGKFLENKDGDFGLRFKEAKQATSKMYSDATQAAEQKFQAAEGIGGKLQAAIENPSVIAKTVGTSLGAMGAGGVAARGLLAASRLGTMGASGAAIAGGAGEGSMMAGAQAESIRQQTDDGLLTPKQSAISLGTGLIGGGIGVIGSRAGRALGVGDIDTLIANGATRGVAREGMGAVNRVGRAALTEGLEELTQSLEETGLQNIALDRNFTEGMDEAAVLGTLSGGLMGGAAGAMSRPAIKPSEAMGLDPAAGPLSRAAATAVDSGATPPATPPATIQPEQVNAEQTQADPAVAQAADGIEVQTRESVLPVADQQAGIDGAPTAGIEGAQRLPAVEPIPLEARSLDELRQSLRNAQDPAIRRTVAAEIRRRRESMPDPLQQQEATLEPQAVETQQEQSKEPQAPAADAEPAAESTGISGIGEQGSIPALRPERWRQNALQAGKVARGLGLDPKGKRLAQIVAEIDAKDSNVGPADSVRRSADTGTGQGIAQPGAGVPAGDGIGSNAVRGLAPANGELAPGGDASRRPVATASNDPVALNEPSNVQDAQSRPTGTEAQAAPVEASTPARGDAAKAAGVPAATGAGDVQADGLRQLAAKAKKAQAETRRVGAISSDMDELLRVSQAEDTANESLSGALESIPDDLFGVQAKTTDGRQIMLTPSAQNPGQWQLTRFAKDGQPWGDSQYTSKKSAVLDFLREVDIGTLDAGGHKQEAKAPAPEPHKPAPAPAKKPVDRTASLRKAEWKKNPLRSFLGQHGLSMDLAKEFAPGITERRKSMVGGYGPIFRKSGKNIDLLAEIAREEGFISADQDATDLYELIAAVFRGERVAPMFTADAAQDEMQSRVDAMREVAAAGFDDFLAEQQAMGDPLAALTFEEYTLSDLDGSGYAEASPELKAEVAALSAQLDAMGVDVEGIAERVAQQTQEKTANEYHEALKQALQSAHAETQATQPGSIRNTGEDGRSQTGSTGEQDGLTAPSRADIEAQQARTEQADKLDERAQVKRESELGDSTFMTGFDGDGRQDTTGDIFGGVTQAELEPVRKSIESMRRELIDLENKIVGVAGMAPGFIEDAMRSRKVPAQLKQQRDALREKMREERERVQSAQPKAEPDFLQTLFGTDAATIDADPFAALEAAASKGAKQHSKDIARIRDAIKTEKDRAKADFDDWSGRVYKRNKAQVDLRGDGPGKHASMSVGSINESRRRNAMEALNKEMNELEKLEKSVATDEGAERVIGRLNTLMDMAQKAVDNGSSTFKTVDEQFQYMLLDSLEFRGPAGKGNITSNGLSKAMLDAVKAQPKAEKPAEDEAFMGVKDGEPRNLVAMHNLTADNLLYADSMGGIPVPSIGITKIDTPFSGFGDVTLIAPSSMVDPEHGTPVFDRDAWTARFPTMNFKKVKAKVADAFYERMKPARQMGDDGDSFTSLLWEKLRNANVQSPDKVADLFQRYNAAKMFYAKEVLGKDIKVPMRDSQRSYEFSADKQLLSYWKENGSELSKMDRDLSGPDFYSSDKFKAFSNEVKEAIGRAWADRESNPQSLSNLRKIYLDDMFGKDGVLYPASYTNMVKDFGKVGQKEIDRMKLGEAVSKVVKSSDEGYQRWVKSLVEPLFEAPTITVRGKEVEPTIDNIVASMTIGATQGAEKSLTFGPGKTAAMLGKRFKSMAEIKAARDQVVSQAAEAEGKKTTEAILDEYRTRVASSYKYTDWRGNIDTWAANDASMEALAKAGKAGGSNSDIRQALVRAGFKTVDQTTVDLASQSIKALRNAATDYFEAKPQRAVKLNEFRAAVIPKEASQEVRDILTKNGIEFIEFNKKTEGARDAAIQKMAKRVDKAAKDILFMGDKSKSEQGTPTDRAVMDMAGDGKSANEILRFISTASKSPFNRQIARLLVRTGANPAVSLGGEMGGGAGFKFLAKYSRKNHEVTLSEAAAGKAEQIFLHETVHAATLLALDKKGLIATQMNRLYEHVKQQGGANGQYGMKNVGEFVAEAFTNPEFQKVLKGMKADNRSLWERFVNIVRRILGMADTQQDALSRALELGAEVMRENAPLRKAKSFLAEDGPAYMRSEDTRKSFDARVDELFSGSPANRVGPRILDRSDVMSMLGYADKPVVLAESKVIQGMENHPEMTADVWKKIPGWLENPAAVFDSETDGGLVVIAPDTVGGKAVSIIVRPDGESRNALNVHLLLNAYSRSPSTPYQRWISQGLLRYADQKKFPALFEAVAGRQLPSTALQNKPGTKRILTEKNLSGWRKANQDDEANFGVADAVEQINKQAAVKPVVQFLNDTFKVRGKLHWWHKTVGTPFNLAERVPEFKRVFNAVQDFITSVSFYGAEAAAMAPKIIPKLESWKDLGKSPISAADNKAIASPIFEGTLSWRRDSTGKPVLADSVEEAGIVWTDDELRSKFLLTDEQVGLYREFRAATDKSLTGLALSDMLQFAGDDAKPIRDVVMGMSLKEGSETLSKYLKSLATGEEKTRKGILLDTANTVMDRADKAQSLIDRGYAPLQRFGRHTIYAKNDKGEQLFFGMYEDRWAAGRAARQMREQYPDATVEVGMMSEQSYKMFQGISPETLELFGTMLGMDANADGESNKAFQMYLKLAKSNRSALKRLIERKGISGYSEDASRVLASFIYSNARQTSTNLHVGDIMSSVNDIPRDMGDAKDAAMKLARYTMDPQEEAQALRGLLFAQYLGGSIASAAINALQPAQVTFPYLSQFVGAKRSGALMAGAVRDALKKSTGDAKLDAELRKAEEEGIVSPQEIFQLMAQAQGKATLKAGDGTTAGDAAATASNTLARLALGWGKVFSIPEQFNRRTTFIAAYRTARETGEPNPYEFAKQAVKETQLVYNKGNRPEWARGTVGALAFTFKTYSISYVELLQRMASNGPEGRRAAMLMVAVLFLMAGAGGLPGIEDAENVVDGIAQRVFGLNFQSRQKRQEWLAEVFGEGGARFIENGLSGLPWSPTDVSGRLGLGNLIPGTGVFVKKQDYSRDIAEIAGPAADMTKRFLQGAGLLLQGEVLKAGEIVSPAAVRNMIQGGRMMTTGQYSDAKGKKVVDTTFGEGVTKFIGFQPADVSKVQESTGTIQQMIALNKIRESEIADKWANGLASGDPDRVQDARDELVKWNRANPDSPIRINMSQIFKRVKALKEDKATRIERTAPKEIRQEVRRELESRQ